MEGLREGRMDERKAGLVVGETYGLTDDERLSGRTYRIKLKRTDRMVNLRPNGWIY